MDAGKIRSFTSGIDLRADHGLGSQSGHHSDAEIIVSKVAGLLALDSLTTRTDARPKSDVPAMPRPGSDVVVKLSIAALAAAAGLRVERNLTNLPDYNHLDPHKPHPELHLPEPGAQPPDETGMAIVGSPARPAHEPSSLSTGPGVRPDLHPQGLHHVALPGQFVRISTQKAPAAAASDARDTERLAGLALAAERLAGTPTKLGSIALAAAILGALIVVSLI